MNGKVSTGLKVISAMAVPRIAAPECEHVVAKSVRAEWNVEWIASRFSPTVVIVERHPLNVLASWSELGFGDSPNVLMGLGRYSEALWGVSAPAPDAALIARQAYVYGVGAAALRDAMSRHPEWIKVQHEALCLDPQTLMRRLLADVGLEWGDGTERYLAESDREGTGYHTQRKAREQPDRWRSRLTAEQVDTVVAQLGEFPFGLVPS